MNKITIILIILVMTSCKLSNKSIEKSVIKKPNQEYKLKIGPLWVKNEDRIDFVFGVNEYDRSKDFITEVHFNFGGNIECGNKVVSVNFDFEKSKSLILPDSINKLLPSSKKLVLRQVNDNVVSFKYENPVPNILLFSIEKVNLKPNGNFNTIRLSLNSECNKYLEFPLNLIKYEVEDFEYLVDNYIKRELNLLSKNELKNFKAIFSFNEVFSKGNFNIDMVNQLDMLILSYDISSEKFFLKSLKGDLIREIEL